MMELRDEIVAVVLVRNRGYVWQEKMRMKKRVWIMLVVVMVGMIMMIIMVNMTIVRVMMIIVMVME